MSSPIAITSSHSRAASTSSSSPSSSLSSTGLYVPVHRRGASASLASSPLERGAPSSPSRSSASLRSPKLRVRSVSPACSSRVAPVSHPIPTHIPTSTSTIPGVYTPAQLLALASSPLAGLAPAQRAQVAAHVPFMTRRSSPNRKSDRDAASARADSPTPSVASSSSSPSSRPREISVEDSTQIANAPKANNNNTKADAPRRRRAGRKTSAAKPRVSAAVTVDVEGRRRQRQHGAGWGWPAAAAHGSESWRAHAAPVVLSA